MGHDYIAGMTWGWTGVRGTWTGPAADLSMGLMVERLGTTWTALTFAAYQDTAQSTEIHFRRAPTVTDDEVRAAVIGAKSLGLAVCLKPVVNCTDGTWRAHINFFDLDVPCEPTWAQWFASYTELIVHYARLAEETGAEYDAAVTATSRRPWVGGSMLWDWPAELHDEAAAAPDGDYCMLGKRAERTVREHVTARTGS